VDSVCKSLRRIEEECYIEDSLNEKLVPEFSKTGDLLIYILIDQFGDQSLLCKI